MRGLRVVISCAACCLFGTAPLGGADLVATDLLPGSSSASTPDGRLVLAASAGLSVGPGFFGVSGGTNGGALDDADGLEPADEWIDLAFAADSGLQRMDVKWTRAVVTIRGFTADPAGDAGSYNALTGTWSVEQTWTGSTTVSYRFANPAASAGATLRLTSLDPGAAGPQIALVRLSAREPVVDPADVVLEADPAELGQVLDHFGASMLWSIDPTEDWPEEAKEKLARRLVSRADGIGLSNLRFDFGGGDNGTGYQTVEPWSWRFPRVLKDGPEEDFDWTRRAGQQDLLRRTRDLGLEKFTLASISPPWWLTKNGRAFCSDWVGGSNFDPAQAGAYADYLAEVIRHFRDVEGVTFAHVSPLNEPEWPWEDGSQEGCRYRAEDARPLVAALHQRLVADGLDDDCKILLGEHGVVNSMLDDAFHQAHDGGNWTGGNNSLGYGKFREYLKDLTTHPDVVGKIDPVAAYHSYGTDGVGTLNSNLRSLAAQNAAQRGVGLVQSEYCILGGYGPVRDLQMEPARHVFRVIHKDLTDAGALGWSWWLALSPHDYKDGLLYTNDDGSLLGRPEIYESKVYWILGNFSRFIRPGWRRIGGGGHGNTGGVMSSSWISPDGREVAIVTANFGPAALEAALPATVGGLPLREWEPWVTDRGRSLRRESPVAGRFDLAPLSVTTFVGRVNEAPFRLRVAVSGHEAPVPAGATVTLAAAATWEDGVRRIPSPDPAADWVFQPLDREPAGTLRAGRYQIRRLADGGFLATGENGALAAPLRVDAGSSPDAHWDVVVAGPDRLLITHVATGRILDSSSTAVRAGGEAVAAVRVPVPAALEWDDKLGTGAEASLPVPATRRVMVEARRADASAATVVPVRAGGPGAVIEGLPEFVFTRPGEPVSLSARLRDDGDPWRFRLVPSDRDPVIVAANGALGMRAPGGAADETWELVEPGGSRVWAMPEAGRNCWIRSVGNGFCLAPVNGGSVPGTAVQALAPQGTASEWRVEADGPSRFRILNPASGMVLNISGGTGLPILWPDANAGNDRFHLDSTGGDAARMVWSHGLGDEPAVTIAPLRTTTVTVHAERGGSVASAATTIVARRLFSEWSQRWFGGQVAPDEDSDGDGASNLLEYSRGSSPLEPDLPSQWQEFDGSTVGWPLNREAMGEWRVQSSADLVNWHENDGSYEVVVQAADRIEARLAAGRDRLFLRLQFIAAEAD